MSSMSNQSGLPGRPLEEESGIIDEAPLPVPTTPDQPIAATDPISPNDPLINEPLGGLVPNDPISEGIPGRTTSESPHAPEHTGNRPNQPTSGQATPGIPATPEQD